MESTENVVETTPKNKPALLGKFKRVNKLFMGTVVLPTLLASVYFGMIASDVYISEAHFVVRSPQKQTAAGLGAILQNAGFSRSQDDTHMVHDYMLSRDALNKLNKELNLAANYKAAKIDMFSRFNGFGIDDSFEALFLYYQKKVALELDATTAISSLRVQAFSADDAFKTNEMLLQMGEKLVNQLNERGRQDMIRFAQTEVDNATAKAKNASLALSEYRNTNTVFDPERQSGLQLQMITKLQDELIAAKTQLAQVVAVSPQNPQIPALRLRVSTINEEIESAMSQVAGDKASLTTKSSDYERLVLDRAFADKQLAASMAALEQAKNDAQRKQLYLERVVHPSRPDVAVEPRRIRGILSTFALGMVVWFILSVLLAGIREHKD